MLTAFEEYIIAIGGVDEGIALDMDAARPAAIIGGMGLNPAPTANEAAMGHMITAEAVFDAVYDNIKLIIALIAKILHAEILDPALCAIKLPIKDARPLCSIPSPNTKPPPNKNNIFQSIAFSISFQLNIG